MIAAWFSGGATSAVACKMALESMENVKVIYIETGSHHLDSQRFLRDCEKWYGVKIQQIQHWRFNSVPEVLRTIRFLNGPKGAACTRVLKRQVRESYEKFNQVDAHVWGFDASEKKRVDRMRASPGVHHCILYDRGITKKDCLDILRRNKIRIPMMYHLGFTNSNCLGCPKGGAAYWNLIRRRFPRIFAEMAAIEREIGRSCLKKWFLDELPLDAGRGKPPLVAECGSVGEGCEIELSRQWAAME